MRLDYANVVTTSIDADGFETLQHDAYGEQNSGMPPATREHMLGSWARPLDPQVDGSGQPVPSQACGALITDNGGRISAFALGDPRSISKLVPAPAPGEHVVYNCFGAFVRLHADGSISTVTTSTGGGLDGHTVASVVAPDRFARFAPWGREVWNASGYRLKFGGADGSAKVALGYSAGSYYFRVQANAIELNAAEVSIGPNDSLPQPVAKAAALVAILQQVAAALAALQASVAASPSGGAASAGLVTAAVASIQGALVAISTQSAIG